MKICLLLSGVGDPRHFGTDPDADPRIRTSDQRIRMQIREAQSHPDSEIKSRYTDPFQSRSESETLERTATLWIYILSKANKQPKCLENYAIVSGGFKFKQWTNQNFKSFKRSGSE
jgi:hypothetical protein